MNDQTPVPAVITNAMLVAKMEEICERLEEMPSKLDRIVEEIDEASRASVQALIDRVP